MRPLTGPAAALVERLRDRRSRQVMFLSHCLLNENTRYLGGAGRPACLQEVVEGCIAANLGMVQMPCPEQRAWGGVLKTRFLPVIGLARRQPLLFVLRRPILWCALLYTRVVYRRLARQVAREIEDYVGAGFCVAGVVGIDGSPTCGVVRTVDIDPTIDALARLDAPTVEQVNGCVRANLVGGRGLFITALRSELDRRGLSVPILAHDIESELDGRVAFRRRLSAAEQQALVQGLVASLGQPTRGRRGGD